MIRLLIILTTVLFTGCASVMKEAPVQEISTPDQSEAQVIFMRSSFLGSAVSASLYEVVDDEIKFIGVINNDTKIAYDTAPGEHVFMVVSEAADFMEAELVPGKNYFSIVTPRMGAWVARFSLWPIKVDTEAEYNTSLAEFEKWKENTTLVERTPEADAWYKKNAAGIRAKYEKYWPAWQKKSQADIAERTLIPEDGQ